MTEGQIEPLAIIEAMLKSVRQQLQKAIVQEKTLVELLAAIEEPSHD